MPYPTHLDLAWAAGFIDGEGTFNWNVTKGNYGVPRFSVNQVDSEPIERLMDIFPFLNLSYVDFQKSRNRADNHRRQDQWSLWCNGYEKVQALLAMLWPYLSKFKRDAAVAALTRFKEQSHSHGSTP